MRLFLQKKITLQICEKGKSADKSQNVRLAGLLQNFKKRYMGFFVSLRGSSSTL